MYTDMENELGADLLGPNFISHSALINVTYFKPQCTQYANSSALSSFDSERSFPYKGSRWWSVGNCTLGKDVTCEHTQLEARKTCRLSIRMFAAITLAGCLIIKATYMITVNIRARRKIKTDCLTFGDVIVASALDSTLQTRNECLVNTGEGKRHRTGHTCHKHCRDLKPSMTGDSIGHCQKCAKFNTVDKAADLFHPSIAIKYKQSLLSNLGSAALSQMIILMICSLGMLVGSIILAMSVATSAQYYNYYCTNATRPRRLLLTSISDIDCTEGLQSYLKYAFGSFGGFNTSASLANLPQDSLASETAAFAISNGTQLIFSVLYLLLVYNITLISIENDWGAFEKHRQRPRCTIVRGDAFDQSYLLQLPRKVLFPMMIFSAAMHWLLGQAVSTREAIVVDQSNLIHPKERSQYTVRVICLAKLS